MTLQQSFVLAVLSLLVILLIRGRHAPAHVFAGAAAVFLFLDLVTLDQVLKDFSNSGLLTVVLLLLVSVALDKSHLLDVFADRIVRGGYRWSLLKLMLATSAYSAFLNNTAVVASLIGPLRASREHSASRLLLPMCYAASIGGILTLVGTSTNLLVNTFIISRGLPPLQMFDLLPVGLLILGTTTLTMLLLYPRVLPQRDTPEDAPEGYFLEARVNPGSNLVGRSVHESGLRNLHHLFLSEILRGDRLIAAVEPDEVIAANDLLIFAGDVTRLDVLARFDGLTMYSQRQGLPIDNLVEVIVAAHAPIARHTVREVNFRSQFDAAVVAIRRGERRLPGSIGDTTLEVGDVLVLAVGTDFEKRNNLTRNFVIVSRPALSKYINPRHGVMAVLAFAVVVGLSAFGVIDLLKGLLMMLAGFMVFGFVRPAELRRNMPFDLILIIGSALVLSDVMLDTGTAGLLSAGLLYLFAPFGMMGALASVLLLTWLLTELMSNNAAAALAFPIAMAVADKLGAQPAPFVMAALYGASASFLTPYGYQTNLMVMAPGKYALSDYLRAGSPVALAYLATALVAIPWFFPFKP
jgi:di/tricarboxylate transporter